MYYLYCPTVSSLQHHISRCGCNTLVKELSQSVVNDSAYDLYLVYRFLTCAARSIGPILI